MGTQGSRGQLSSRVEAELTLQPEEEEKLEEVGSPSKASAAYGPSRRMEIHRTKKETGRVRGLETECTDRGRKWVPSSQCVRCGLSARCAVQIHMRVPSPPPKGGDSGDMMSREGSALMNGISVLVRETGPDVVLLRRLREKAT